MSRETLWIEFPEKPPGDVIVELHNGGWWYDREKRRWWLEQRQWYDSFDDALDRLSRRLKQHGLELDEMGEWGIDS